jgi:ribonuclease G
MKSRKHQNQIYKTMKAAVRRDRARTNVLPISELGLMEMTRQRQEESLLSQMYIDCPYCKGHGVIKSPLALSVDIQRQVAAIMRKSQNAPGATELQILVAPSVMDRLRNEDEQMLVEMQRRYGGHLTFKSEVARHPESFAILNRDGKVLYAVSESKTV